MITGSTDAQRDAAGTKEIICVLSLVKKFILPAPHGAIDPQNPVLTIVPSAIKKQLFLMASFAVALENSASSRSHCAPSPRCARLCKRYFCADFAVLSRASPCEPVAPVILRNANQANWMKFMQSRLEFTTRTLLKEIVPLFLTSEL